MLLRLDGLGFLNGDQMMHEIFVFTVEEEET